MFSYYLVPNKLQPDKGNFTAVTTGLEVVSFDEVIDQTRREGGVLITGETENAIRNVFRTIIENAGRGKGFSSPYFNISLSVRGVFQNDQSIYDPEKHYVGVSISPGVLIRRAISNVGIPEKVGAPDYRRPVLQHFFDKKSKTTNVLVTPGHVAELRGSFLKVVNIEDPQQGVFFIRQSDGEEFRASHYYRNTMGIIDLDIPEEMGSGFFAIEVRSVLYKGGDLLRVSSYKTILESVV